MENQTGMQGRVRFIRCKASMLTKIVVLTALVLSITAIFTLLGRRRDLLEQTALLERQAETVAAENQRLEQDIDQLDTPENFRKIAQEELGLVDPGVVVFTPQPQ